MGVPLMLYTHWKTYPSRAVTSSTPVTVTLCSVLFWKEYIVNPGKAEVRSCNWPPSAVSLCIQVGSERISSCLQMRVSMLEHSPPWISKETVKPESQINTMQWIVAILHMHVQICLHKTRSDIYTDIIVCTVWYARYIYNIDPSVLFLIRFAFQTESFKVPILASTVKSWLSTTNGGLSGTNGGPFSQINYCW